MTKTFLKYVVLGLLLVVLFSGNLDTSVLAFPGNVSHTEIREDATQRNLAKILTEEGHQLLNQGNAEAARQRWKQATEIYKELNYEDGIKGSQINESIALRSRGFFSLSCQTLQTALKLPENSSLCSSSTPENFSFSSLQPTQINALGLRHLGETLRLMGKLEESNSALSQSWQITQQISALSEASQVLLAWGNTQQDLFKSLRNFYQKSNNPSYRQDAFEKAKLALKYYSQVGDFPSSSLTQMQAKVNHFSLLVELKEWLEVVSNNSILENEVKNTLEILEPTLESLQHDFNNINLPLTKEAIYVYLSFAQSLSKLQEYEMATQHTMKAISQGEKLGDKATESYAWGTLGNISEKQQLFPDAQIATQKAISLSSALLADDISYLWQWQLGRIYKAQNLREEATKSYDVAILNLDKVRKNLLGVHADAQFSFSEQVEPIYRQYLELLLQPNASPTQLNQAIEVIKSLKIAELEDYLQCNLDLELASKEAEEQPAAIIYTIFVNDTIKVITKIPSSDRIILHSPSASTEEFESTVFSLKDFLSDPKYNSKFIHREAKKLYSWLIEPIASELPENGTIVFASEQVLQNLPMAILYDGQDYLIEKYSIATSLNAQLPTPQTLQPRQLEVLLAGVSQKSEHWSNGLSSLPYVKNELNKIQSLVPSHLLLNSDFTRTAFKNLVKHSDFSIVHIATHGKFSSNPQETVIYAWDNPINVQEFDSILRAREETNATPISLLVLSACETAKGDKQATLGLAGVALNANTSSILASLWQVADEETASFMAQFYEKLKQPNMTKAEALRQVQNTFLDSGEHPYYWSAFILAGNWL